MSLLYRGNDVDRQSFHDKNQQGHTSGQRLYFVGRYGYKGQVTDFRWREFIEVATLPQWRLATPNVCRFPAGWSATENHVSNCVETLAILTLTDGLPTSKYSLASVGLPWITDVPTPGYVRNPMLALSANDGNVF